MEHAWTASPWCGSVYRVLGMAASQAEIVHEGVDVEVEVGPTGSLECACIIAAHVV